MNLTLNALEESPRQTSKKIIKNEPFTAIDLSNMGLKALSLNLYKWYTFLSVINISNNQLRILSPMISELTQLVYLDLSSNQLQRLPPELGLLSQLQTLYLHDNLLTSLPHELGMLYQLNKLTLDNNPLADIIFQIEKQSCSQLIHYLRDNAPKSAAPEARTWDPSLKDPCNFTILSYNILAQKYARPKLYGYTPNWALDWMYRRDKIMSELSLYKPDIICLQEVEHGEFDSYFSPKLANLSSVSYKGVFFQKSRAKTMSDVDKKSVDGCAIFARMDKFDIQSQHLLEFNELALKQHYLDKTDSLFTRLMQRDNIAVVAMLRHRHTHIPLWVVNCHIHWDPNFNDVKILQTAIMLEEVAKLVGNHPLIICGDFNSTPDSAVVTLMTEKKLSGEHPELLGIDYGESLKTHGLKNRLQSLSNAYEHNILPFTNYTPGFKGVIDYIFYSDRLLQVCETLGGIGKEYYSKYVGFPNAHLPSEYSISNVVI
eukprot:NODE_291_length_11621_cov_0.390557.p1 type:complete len:486 gc:universal NODE_291_length_11621_cov_0.390557:780-2237(+)